MPSASCDLNGCESPYTGLFLFFLGINDFVEGRRAGFPRACGPCVQGTLTQGCIYLWMAGGLWGAWLFLSSQSGSAGLSSFSSYPQPHCFLLPQHMASEPANRATEQPAKGMVAAWLLLPLAEVSRLHRRRAASWGHCCSPVCK